MIRRPFFSYNYSSGSNFSWASAISNNKLQAYLKYYDSSSANITERKYKYVATSDLAMDDTNLTRDRGYWLYSNESGNLTLPGVGGSLSNESYVWSKLRFRNSSGSELNVTDAWSDGWINCPGCAVNNKIWYWDLDAFGDPNWLKIPADNTTLSPSKGYFIWGNYDNITLIRQN